MKSLALSLLLLMAITVCLTSVVGFANNSVATYREQKNKRPAAQIFKKYCTECHGVDGRAQTKKGKYSHARDIADGQWQDEVSDERIFNSIMNGRNIRGNMPGFSKEISDEEANALVTYVRQLRK